jgi:hypothetical protein
VWEAETDVQRQISAYQASLRSISEDRLSAAAASSQSVREFVLDAGDDDDDDDGDSLNASADHW